MNQVQLSRPITLDASHDTWTGNSSFLQVIKQRLVTMAKSPLPVLILGMPGTGKEIAARMLHKHGDANDRPFICISCHKISSGHFAQQLEDSYLKARGGSLYIRNLEVLTERESELLKQFWVRFDVPEQNVRLLVGYSDTKIAEASESALDGDFAHWLYYHCLTIELPTLANRADDIEDLVRRYQTIDPAISQLSFQPSAWEVLKSYGWPGNVKQLKRCLDKLAIQANSSIVNREVLLACFPSMGRTEVEEGTPVPKNVRKDILSVKAPKKPIVYQYDGQNSDGVVSGYIEPDSLNPLNDIFREDTESPLHTINHPALNKAIVYLYHNYRKPMNMDELACQACISPSHLSYLFKHYLGMSFKQVLLRLRIVKAMELLSENPNRQVTQVCDDVGFSDLSFFVRKFKSTVGMSPGVYRDQYGHTDSSPELLVVEEALTHPLLQFPVRH